MRVGVVVTLDGTPEVGDQFQIYRVVDGLEQVLGTGYVRKPIAASFKINPPDTVDGQRGAQFPDVQEGDLVRSI